MVSSFQFSNAGALISIQILICIDSIELVYSTNASFVYSEDFTSPVLKLLAPQKGEVILDLGSGSGELSLRISELLGNKGTLILVDSSPSLMEKAEFILRGKKGISFILEDGHNLINLDIRPVDAVFSNAALHWMKKDPGLVVEGVFKNLKKGGRFCGEFGGFLNMVGVRSSLHTALKSRGKRSYPQ